MRPTPSPSSGAIRIRPISIDVVAIANAARSSRVYADSASALVDLRLPRRTHARARAGAADPPARRARHAGPAGAVVGPARLVREIRREPIGRGRDGRDGHHRRRRLRRRQGRRVRWRRGRHDRGASSGASTSSSRSHESIQIAAVSASPTTRPSIRSSPSRIVTATAPDGSRATAARREGQPGAAALATPSRWSSTATRAATSPSPSSRAAGAHGSAIVREPDNSTAAARAARRTPQPPSAQPKSPGG